MGPRQLSAKLEDWERPPGWDRSQVRYSFMIENDDSANFIPLTVQITNHHRRCGPHPLCPPFPTFLVLSMMAAMPPSPPISHVVSLPFDPPTGAAHLSTNWRGARRQWLRFRWVSFVGFGYDQGRWGSTTVCRCYCQGIPRGFGHPWNPLQTHNATCTLHCEFPPPSRRAGVWRNFFHAWKTHRAHYES